MLARAICNSRPFRAPEGRGSGSRSGTPWQSLTTATRQHTPSSFRVVNLAAGDQRAAVTVERIGGYPGAFSPESVRALFNRQVLAGKTIRLPADKETGEGVREIVTFSAEIGGQTFQIYLISLVREEVSRAQPVPMIDIEKRQQYFTPPDRTYVSRETSAELQVALKEGPRSKRTVFQSGNLGSFDSLLLQLEIKGERLVIGPERSLAIYCDELLRQAQKPSLEVYTKDVDNDELLQRVMEKNDFCVYLAPPGATLRLVGSTKFSTEPFLLELGGERYEIAVKCNRKPEVRYGYGLLTYHCEVRLLRDDNSRDVLWQETVSFGTEIKLVIRGHEYSLFPLE